MTLVTAVTGMGDLDGGEEGEIGKRGEEGEEILAGPQAGQPKIVQEALADLNQLY